MADNIADRITAYGRMREGKARANLRANLIEDAVQLHAESKVAEMWLEDNWTKGGDEDYVETLHQYEEVCDLRDRIRRDVLGGGGLSLG